MNKIVSLDVKDNIHQIAENLRALLKEHQVSENEIAQSLNIPVMTVRRLVSGETTDPRISTLKMMADYFHVSVDSLIEENKFKPTSTMRKTIPQFIPILDWDIITSLKRMDDLDLKSWKKWHPVILAEQTILNNHAFCLESRPSMQPRFPLGTLFIVDPDEVPHDGDIVLVKMKESENVSLREIIIDIPKWQLQPVIAGSETIFYDTKQHQIIGTIVLTYLHCKKEK